MKIEIVSGQPYADVESFFETLLPKYVNPHSVFKFPEYRMLHPVRLLNDFREVVREHIEENKDLYVLTYSDHILNAIRLEVKKHKFNNANLHQIRDDGSDMLAFIDEDGMLSYWEDNVFNLWDKALIELLSN
jgi:predicted ATPase